jgi:hypothetical protein
MKILVWAVFGVLVVTWTLGALIVVELAQWGAQAIASGAASELGRSAAQWPAPAWLSLWLDPTTIKIAQEGLLTGFEVFRSALPWVGSAVGWLVPLAWISWGIGVALLLAMAGGAHWLASRWLVSRDTRTLRNG